MDEPRRSQKGNWAETGISGFNYGELGTIEARGRKDTLQNKSAFSQSRISVRGAKEDTTGLEFSTSHK